MDLIILYFLAKKIGALALTKGLKPLRWKLYTVGAWIVGEMVGIGMAINMFGPFDLKTVDWRYAVMGLFVAFGGFLLVHYILENKPDYQDDDMNKVRADELGPPRSN